MYRFPMSLKRAVAAADDQPPFQAFDTLWTALAQAANQRAEKSERARMRGLVHLIAPDELTTILTSDALAYLASLDPPLESLLSNEHERLAENETVEAFHRIREQAIASPRLAIDALAEILHRVRNKRAHGFKSSDIETRDGGILRAATILLRQLCVELGRLSTG
jgi:hypothetical protein